MIVRGHGQATRSAAGIPPLARRGVPLGRDQRALAVSQLIARRLPHGFVATEHQLPAQQEVMR